MCAQRGTAWWGIFCPTTPYPRNMFNLVSGELLIEVSVPCDESAGQAPRPEDGRALPVRFELGIPSTKLETNTKSQIPDSKLVRARPREL